MVKYPLEQLNCFGCGAPNEVNAALQQHSVEWTCVKCKRQNFVLIDTINIREGQQLLQAAKGFIKTGDADIAAILLVSSVDSSLSTGICDLTSWRAIQRLESPPTFETIEKELERMNWSTKTERFERLAGVKMYDEIIRLYKEGKIPTQEISSYGTLVANFKIITKQRNRLVHLGQPVDFDTIRSGFLVVERIVFLLETMYHSAYDLNRPPLPGWDEQVKRERKK